MTHHEKSASTNAVKQDVANHPLPVARSRAERISERLVELLHKLSGLAVADIDPKASFLEMGFDSLFLTQASLRFKSEFKIKITFRQLFDDAPDHRSARPRTSTASCRLTRFRAAGRCRGGR